MDLLAGDLELARARRGGRDCGGTRSRARAAATEREQEREGAERGRRGSKADCGHAQPPWVRVFYRQAALRRMGRSGKPGGTRRRREARGSKPRKRPLPKPRTTSAKRPKRGSARISRFGCPM